MVRLSRRTTALAGVSTGEYVVVIFFHRTVKRLLKDGFFLVYFELGLEVGRVVRDAAAVGAAATLGKSKALIGEFITDTTPEICVSMFI
mgnify:CR=1 FL=1